MHQKLNRNLLALGDLLNRQRRWIRPMQRQFQKGPAGVIHFCGNFHLVSSFRHPEESFTSTKDLIQRFFASLRMTTLNSITHILFLNKNFPLVGAESFYLKDTSSFWFDALRNSLKNFFVADDQS